MQDHSHPHTAILYFISVLMGMLGMLEIKPILDIIFVSLGIIGLIVSIVLNIKRLFSSRYKK